MASCKDCRFSEAGPDELRCRRFPPMAVTYPTFMGQSTTRYVWACVGYDDWCGEYQEQSASEGGE